MKPTVLQQMISISALLVSSSSFAATSPIVERCLAKVHSTVGTTTSISGMAAQAQRQAAAIAECEQLGQGKQVSANGALAGVALEAKHMRFADHVEAGRHPACRPISNNMRLVISKLGPTSNQFYDLVGSARKYSCV